MTTRKSTTAKKNEAAKKTELEETETSEAGNTNARDKTDFELTVSDFHVPRVERPQVEAGCCPNNAAHRSVQVYRTVGRKRYCKCNDCGANWTKTGEFANGLVEYASNLAKVLEQAEPVEAPNGIPVICLAVDDAKSITEALRELIQA